MKKRTVVVVVLMIDWMMKIDDGNRKNIRDLFVYHVHHEDHVTNLYVFFQVKNHVDYSKEDHEIDEI